MGWCFLSGQKLPLMMLVFNNSYDDAKGFHNAFPSKKQFEPPTIDSSSQSTPGTHTGTSSTRGTVPKAKEKKSKAKLQKTNCERRHLNSRDSIFQKWQSWTVVQTILGFWFTFVGCGNLYIISPQWNQWSPYQISGHLRLGYVRLIIHNLWYRSFAFIWTEDFGNPGFGRCGARASHPAGLWVASLGSRCQTAKLPNGSCGVFPTFGGSHKTCVLEHPTATKFETHSSLQYEETIRNPSPL